MFMTNTGIHVQTHMHTNIHMYNGHKTLNCGLLPSVKSWQHTMDFDIHIKKISYDEVAEEKEEYKKNPYQ